MTELRVWLPWLLVLCGCQPSTLCDPGQHVMLGGCYPDAPPVTDAGDVTDRDASGSDSGETADSCPGSDAYEGFQRSCSSSEDCGCHAPDCATAPLGYCTKLNCDPSSSTDCPPGWTCLTIPPGASPDPEITHLCLAP